MDLFGREAPKLPDYSITRRGQADGESGGRGRRWTAKEKGRKGGRPERGVSVVKPRRRRCTEQSADFVALATAES